MIIKRVQFQRVKNGNWEEGLFFEANGTINNVLIDNNENIVIPDFDGCVCYSIRGTSDILLTLEVNL